MDATMAMKQRATRYDIGAGSATLPDIVSANGDGEHDGRPSTLVDEPAHWNEQTVPDLPLRVSMSMPPAPRAPTNTAVPQSGTRHRAPSPPPAAPSLAELAGLGVAPSPVPHAGEEARPSFVPPARARASTWAPFAVAVTGIAAAVGVALGNASLTWNFGAAQRAAPLSSAAPRVLAPSARVVVAPAPRPRAPAGPPLEPRARSSALAVPEVRYDELPILRDEEPTETVTRAAPVRRRKLKVRAR
jgi:hypothetical protein